MSKKSFSPLPEVFLSDTKMADSVYRMKKQGRVRNIVGKLYTSNMEDSIDNIASRRLWEIIGMLFPGAIIADRTAITLKPTSSGELFIIAAKTRPVSFGPFTVYPRKGSAPLKDDMPFMRNLFLMSEPRKFLENMRHARKGKASVPRFLSSAEMEEKLDAYIRHNGEEALNNLRDKMRDITDVLGLETEFTTFTNLVSGLLGTGEAKFVTRAAIARSSGSAFDPDRVILFSKLYEELALRPPILRKAGNGANEILCFYEAYFSNYIEGTTFTVDEAADIIFKHKIPEKRPEDAHDIAGTYNVISSAAEMKKTPGDFDSFLSILKERHAKIMFGRPNTMPGKFKEKPNQAGSTLFVKPDLVYGTLFEGFRF